MRRVLLVASLTLACGGTILSTPDSGSGSGITPVKHGVLDKVDLVFMIDNSASMSDKQDSLALAAPTLINRLLNPNCVGSQSCTGPADCASLGAGAQCGGDGNCFVAGDNAACATIANTKLEFAPVHDLHIAIVSSSLGGGGSPDVCVVGNGDPSHEDDRGHLLNRTAGSPEGSIANAKPVDGNGGNFLAWLPPTDPKNAGSIPPNVTPYATATALVTDFQSLVEGVAQHGCGLEAQLESWYRFLVQPDPYDQIEMTNDAPPKATLSGVDATLLKMRHDFLRPDSLVAVIMLTDEEDSWSDPLWLGGYGWTVRTQKFPGGPGQGAGPRGTSECDQPVDLNNVDATGPNNPDCTSCAFPGSAKPISKTIIGDDPNCNTCAGGAATCPQHGWYSTAAPSVSYAASDGLNVRYTDNMRARYGLNPQHNVQRYIDGLQLPTVPDRDHEAHDAAKYASLTQRNCTNPLFAGDLPDGSDTSASAVCNLPAGSRTPDMVFFAIIGGVPNALVGDPSSLDWTAILGKDPSTYQLDGIDPHMIESVAPRAGLQAPGTSYNLGTDPDNGREWNTRTSTAGIDLQYACTFDLPQPKDCTLPANETACDCTGAAASAPDGPPLCSTSTRTTQIRGKAYPTIRELRVAKGLGKQAIVGSICAPSYAPTFNALVDRIRPALYGACFPTAIPQTADGKIACAGLVVYESQTNQAAGCTDPGMSQPGESQLEAFQAGATGPVPVVCALTQLAAPCAKATSPGWCYATHADGCAQTIQFSASGLPAGVAFDLLCQ